MINRQAVESPLEQGVEEEITYTLTTTPWGSSPASVSATVHSVADGPTYTDVTATTMPSGSLSVAGDVITLKPLKSLTENIRYRVEVKFTCSPNIYEAYFIVQCKR
jgi:hypothetical protein